MSTHPCFEVSVYVGVMSPEPNGVYNGRILMRDQNIRMLIRNEK